MKETPKFVIKDNTTGEYPSDEVFVAKITEGGVYLDHDWADGVLFLSHDNFEELNEFRREALKSEENDL